MREQRIEKLKALLELDPNDNFSSYALALEYAGANEPLPAVSLLEALVVRDQSYIPAYQQLGYLYEKIGRLGDAAAIFRRGMRIAAEQGDHHSQSEMQDALDSLES
jgi:Tfp pilus assembly protein PilF